MARAKLSPLLEEASGRYGPYVAARGRSGTIFRARPTPKRRATPDQLANEARLRAAAGVWNDLTDAQYAAWNAYAEGLTRHRPGGTRAYTPIGYNTFLSLALVRLQVAPESPLPAWPPEGSFVGDLPVLSVSAGLGSIRFTASGPNRPGIATDLMVQRLVHRRRKPGPRCRGVAFVSFAEVDPVAVIPLEPGAYACAYRFVERATGRVTGTQLLGVVEVV